MGESNYFESKDRRINLISITCRYVCLNSSIAWNLVFEILLVYVSLRHKTFWIILHQYISISLVPPQPVSKAMAPWPHTRLLLLHLWSSQNWWIHESFETRNVENWYQNYKQMNEELLKNDGSHSGFWCEAMLNNVKDKGTWCFFWETPCHLWHLSCYNFKRHLSARAADWSCDDFAHFLGPLKVCELTNGGATRGTFSNLSQTSKWIDSMIIWVFPKIMVSPNHPFE